jgi:thymidylate synthase
MTGTGTHGGKNQLDSILSTYLGKKGMRRSALQVAVFDPERDHSAEPYLKFPCLQHVTFAPDNNGLCVNAFYAVQYMVERAYGNYLGLCQLGRFVAHELNLPLKRVTCIAGVAQLDTSKASVKTVLGAVEPALSKFPAKEA